MATVVNERDAILAAAPDRILPLGIVQWSSITGDGKPSDFADVTVDAVNAGVSVTEVTGGLQLHNAGAIRAGQLDYNVGTGFFLGYSGTSYKFSVGSPVGNGMNWDGTNFTLRGNLDFSYVQNGPPANANNTVAALSSTAQISSGGITMLGGGSIKGGQPDWNFGTGFFLGWSFNAYKFSIGSAGGQRMTWNGADLEIVGNIRGGNLRIGTGASLTGAALEYNEVSGWLYATRLVAPIVLGENLPGSVDGAIVGITHAQGPGVNAVSRNNTIGHAFFGIMEHTGAAGIVGGANGFDFYAFGQATGTYGPFTGAHDALIKKEDSDLYDPGNIVVDKRLIARNGWSSAIFEVELSSEPYQPAALGVLCTNPRNMQKEDAPAAFIVGWVGGASRRNVGGAPKKPMYSVRFQEDIQKNYKHLAINAVGEGQLWVCGEGGNIAAGDLIVTSSMPGKGMKQTGPFADHVMKYTVAKSREAVNFSGPTDVKRCACIYLCG